MHVSHVHGSRVARVFFSLLLVISLISPLVLTGSARSLVRALRQGNGPRPGAPEGVLPNLDDARNRPATRPSAPPPVPSTKRSRSKPLEPRLGRRVGDPLPAESPSPRPSPSPARSASMLDGGNNYRHETQALTTGLRAASHSHHAPRSASTTVVTPQGGPPVFTDDPLVAGTTIIKGLHLTELRNAVNQARALADLPSASWTDSQPVGVIIKAIHVTELRTRLNDARVELGMAVASYTDPGLSVGYDVRAVHIQELRTQVTATLTTASAGYLINFYQWALVRQPFGNESAYWNDIFRAANQNGQGSLVLGAREFGRTVFESAEYAARNRSDHDYVYDLYKSYLRREPDQQGWDYWTANVPLFGREYVRRGFDESTEFMNLVGAMSISGSPSSGVSSVSSARVNPYNQPGSGLQARDAEWSVPLLSLPGRAGLDLGLSLSYSSMVWTRSGPYIYFDEDTGSPSPGFKLGFPTIQEKVFDAEAGDNVYVLTTPGGRRVELRQVGTSNVYEAGDSSYLQLTDNGNLLVRSTDGTKLIYGWFNHEFRCTEIQDRNGNYITVTYNWLGDITTVKDTLDRTITFTYDTNQNLISITQSWTVNGSPQTHTWATFGWTTVSLQPNFSGTAVVGAPSGSTIPVLSQVGLADGSRHTFEYNAAGQASIIKSYRSDNVLRAYTAYDYQATGDECPRLSATRVWAENWTGLNGVPTEVTTGYSDVGNGSHVITAPDGTVYREFYGGTGASSVWQKGLPIQTEVWSGGVRQKWTTLAWTQDNTGVNYQTNPRVTESTVNDTGNSRRTTVSYQSFTLTSGATINLPSDTHEYAADGGTILRHAQTDYRMATPADAAYLDRHILGLVKEQRLYEVTGGVETLMSRVGFQYDDPGSIQGTDAPVQHHASYNSGFVIGRGNLSSVKRYDANDGSHSLSSMRYNTAGSVVASIDPLSHQTLIAYADSFSDGINNRNTLAYPTTVTDAGVNNSVIQYNFDFGARTRVQGPPPAGQPQGLIQTLTYDAAARIDKVTTANNGAYTRYVYGPNYMQSFSTVNTVADEAYAIQVFDGVGQVLGTVRNHPPIQERYSLVNTIYDAMGRLVKQSNPGEVNGSWVPVGDEIAGLNYTTQTYDWNGRPLITTNPDAEGSTKQASYSGCGCAGGAAVTLTDEVGRKQKSYSDVLGRTTKTEVLNPDASVYSATVNTYNARDQIKKVLQYAGAEGSPTSQETTMTYDGHGRLKTKHVPEQNAATVTTWDYNSDDTIQKVTDARGSIANFSYNSRHLTTGITYDPSAGITDTPDVSFGYDAAGNRLSMTDGMGSTSYQYNQLSQLTSEARTFAGLSSQTLSYEYNLASQLKKITDPTNVSIKYNYDAAGRIGSIAGEDTLYGGISHYVTGTSYRAWGGIKAVTYGNNYTSAVSYNSRLQGTLFEVAGRPAQFGGSTVMKTQYQYYADGSLKYAENQQDERFDRAYGYDHTARVKEAYSGSESRDYVNGTNSGTQTGPYRQSYQHDAFGNMTSLNTRFWTRTDGFTASYTNNRRQGFSYDADGRLTADSDLQYGYNAAGRNVSVFSGAQNRMIDSVHDGNGWLTKRTESVGSTVTNTTYYLRSSVLGGRVVTELNQTGQKQKGYVYAGDQVVAEQENNVVSWKYTAPLTGSRGGALADGQFGGEAEFDPMGVNVGFANLFIEPLGGPAPEPFQPMLIGDQSGCGGNPNCTRCSLDGLEISCNEAMHLLDTGAAELQVTLSNGQRITVPVQSYGLGLFRAWVPGSYSDHPGIHDSVDPITGETVDAASATLTQGHWETLSFNFERNNREGRRHHPEPQNYDPRVDFRDYALQLSTNGQPNDCLKLALLAYKAGQVFSDPISGLLNALTDISGISQGNSDPNYRVGVLRRDPYFGNSFGNSGFLPPFQDTPPGNQVRHFVGWFAAGAYATPPLARRELYRQEGTSNPADPDVALGVQAINMGFNFSKTNDHRALAQGIWRDVCGGVGDLKLP